MGSPEDHKYGMQTEDDLDFNTDEMMNSYIKVP